MTRSKPKVTVAKPERPGETPAWRKFEQLVTRVEETLAPKGAIVKSPDKVRDLVSGRLREVDASIRFDVGSTPILITIECRKRRGVQDDTWIEQLATKRAKIGAAKTVAVSATDFSASARATAALYGIELRTFQDRIGEEIVQQFLSGLRLSISVTEYKTRTFAFELEDEPGLAPDNYGDDLVISLRNDGIAAVVAREASTGHPLTVEAMMSRVEDLDVPDNGQATEKRCFFEFPSHTALISTKNGPRFLKRAEIIADFTRRVVPAPATSLYEYAKAEGPIRHTVEAVGRISEHEGLRILLDLSASALSQEAAAPERVSTRKKRSRKPH